MEKVSINYYKYGQLIEDLTQKLKYSKFDLILAPPRGALPIAVHLSHHLSLNLYFNAAQFVEYINEIEQILIVDDIADTGKTLQNLMYPIQYIKSNLRIKTATIYYKPHSMIKPDFYLKETKDWIVFPWECLNERPNREMYKHL